jgi:hypothetical protein
MIIFEASYSSTTTPRRFSLDFNLTMSGGLHIISKNSAHRASLTRDCLQTRWGSEQVPEEPSREGMIFLAINQSPFKPRLPCV